MMRAFVVVVALMVLGAVALVVYPLLRPMPAVVKGEPPPPRAAPLAFALAVALLLGAVGLYAWTNNFPWDNPLSAQALPAVAPEEASAQAMERAGQERPIPFSQSWMCPWRKSGTMIRPT